MRAIPVTTERSRWFWEAWCYKIPWNWEKETMLTSWECIVVHLRAIPMAKTGCKEILGGRSSAQSAVWFAVCLCVGRHLYGRMANCSAVFCPSPCAEATAYTIILWLAFPGIQSGSLKMQSLSSPFKLFLLETFPVWDLEPLHINLLFVQRCKTED